MNWLDLQVIGFLNQFSQRSVALDQAVVLLSQNGLLKGSALAVLIWWAWFSAEIRHWRDAWSAKRSPLNSTAAERPNMEFG